MYIHLNRKQLGIRAVLLCVVLGATLGIALWNGSTQATTLLGNADPMSRSCADSNYVRLQPNFCSRLLPSNTFATLNNTCLSKNFNTLWNVPVTSLKSTIGVLVDINSGGAIALRGAFITFFSDSGCTVQWGSVYLRNREFAAVAAGTQIARHATYVEVPLTNGISYYKANSDTAATASITIQSWGYYD